MRACEHVSDNTLTFPRCPSPLSPLPSSSVRTCVVRVFHVVALAQYEMYFEAPSTSAGSAVSGFLAFCKCYFILHYLQVTFPPKREWFLAFSLAANMILSYTNSKYCVPKCRHPRLRPEARWVSGFLAFCKCYIIPHYNCSRSKQRFPTRVCGFSLSRLPQTRCYPTLIPSIVYPTVSAFCFLAFVGCTAKIILY